MKKIVAMMLALAMALALCVPVFAMDVNSFTDKYTESKDVVVKIEGVTASGAKVYGATIVWEEPTFTYTADGNASTAWDPETHTYKSASTITGSYDKTSVDIVVYNHSNGAVQASCLVGADADSATTASYTYGSYNLTFAVTNPDGNACTMAAAAPNSSLESVKTTFTVKMSGTDTTKLVDNMIAGAKTTINLGVVAVNIVPAA